MATKSNRAAPAPKLAIVEKGATSSSNAAPVASKDDTPAEPAVKAKGLGFWAKGEATVTNEARDKMALMGDVRQRLEHARQLYNEGGNKANEAQEIAADAAMRLYQGRREGRFNNDEISATLGDIFGYKVKGGVQMGATPTTAGVPKDATDTNGKAIASKTPFGPGEAIRKRIVRATQAAAYVYDGDAETFFSGIPEEEVEEVLDAVQTGDMSLFTAYDKFAKLKSEHANRVEMAFDPKKIGSLVEALGSDGAADKVFANKELIAAYQGLVEVLNILGESLAEMDEAA